MSSCNFTTQILDTDCIGDSRVTINNNFSTLDTTACNQQALIASLTSQILTLSANSTSSSSTAKAWVNFSNNTVNGSQTISKQFNVSSVTRTAHNTFDITFTTQMPDVNYVVFGSFRPSSPTPYPFGAAICIVLTQTQTDATVYFQSRGDGDGDYPEPANVSILVFG